MKIIDFQPRNQNPRPKNPKNSKKERNKSLKFQRLEIPQDPVLMYCYLEKEGNFLVTKNNLNTDKFRDELEKQSIKRLKKAPQRIRYYRKSDSK